MILYARCMMYACTAFAAVWFVLAFIVPKAFVATVLFVALAAAYKHQADILTAQRGAGRPSIR